ncbi:MAG: DUF2080 family transposase-associated protein [Candidatus Marsarchaeota archaeon]|nr:DUF2080 family transposase-associated protein [Candidatus Marsarchaeota archaeon]MCL5434727.1 DUF2080 family transposase-associated protein [Candidatus Marsarchaeota archaeon]
MGDGDAVYLRIDQENGVKVRDVVGFMIKKSNPFGTGAKVDCPKGHIGKEAHLIVTDRKAD